MFKINILYINAFPDTYFKKILLESKIGSQICAQKFNRMIIDGLKLNSQHVSVLVTYNPLADESKKIFIKSFDIIEDDINYHFVPALKIKFLGTIYTSIHIKKYIRKYMKRNIDSVLIFDILKPYVYSAVKQFTKYSKNIVSIFTDLPQYFINKNNNLIQKIRNIKNSLIQKYIYNNISICVFITKYMNEKINISNKKSIVIEGLIDSEKISSISNNIDKKNIIMYSGDMSKLYGIDKLIEAFKKLNDKSYELHLYGRCTYIDELNIICKENKNIKYFGIIENEIILERQKEAKLLINPRPIKLEFNRYSFPSKTIEYMSSGTPVLTTKLNGIPSEYDKYLYYIIDDSVDGIRKKINEILNLNDTELLEKAQKAKEFVEKEKNNVVQAKKIIDLIDRKKEI